MGSIFRSVLGPFEWVLKCADTKLRALVPSSVELLCTQLGAELGSITELGSILWPFAHLHDIMLIILRLPRPDVHARQRIDCQVARRKCLF